MLTLFLNFPSGFFRRRLIISVFVVLSMFTMILMDPYHDGFLERYNSLVSLYASFNSGNSFPRFSKQYQYNNMPLIMLKYNGNLPSSDNTAMLYSTLYGYLCTVHSKKYTKVSKISISIIPRIYKFKFFINKESSIRNMHV